ncbi:MAG: cob(I)yrinic acid a,c-diamide adenosyltransferase [Pseudomonadales bacterium]
MANRITRVTTRTGDSGTSATASGRRLPKNHPLFQALGDVDELNSCIGLVCAALAEVPAHLPGIQQSLFDVGACLATEGATPAPDAVPLETLVSAMNAALPPLKEFVLPGGGEAAARCHVARAVCRRAERSVWALGEDYTGCAVYLNRLSDLLFVQARTLTGPGRIEATWRGTNRNDGG